jgi:ribosomal protein S12 methylthiotransferase
MYAHPAHLDEAVIELLGDRRMAAYLDMPIQHADDEVLSAMGRRYTAADLVRLLEKLRRARPEIALRSTCLVGFPGETAAAFRRLLQFLAAAAFDHLGAFAYSREPGTPAARRRRQVPRRTVQRRLDKLMTLQKLVAEERGQGKVGQRLAVLVESCGSGGSSPAFARCEYQAPDVDGGVIITRPHAGLARLRPGSFHDVVVTGVYGYDLVARLV